MYMYAYIHTQLVRQFGSWQLTGSLTKLVTGGRSLEKPVVPVCFDVLVYILCMLPY